MTKDLFGAPKPFPANMMTRETLVQLGLVLLRPVDDAQEFQALGGGCL